MAVVFCHIFGIFFRYQDLYGIFKNRNLCRHAGVFFIALAAMALVWFMYVFAYLARFENGCKATLKNAAIMAIANLPRSLVVLLILAAAIYVCWFLMLFTWFVPAIAMVLINRVLEQVFRKYMSAEELLEEEENDKMRC